MIMHAGFMRTTAAVRGRRYGTTDEALFGRVPLGGSYGCPKEHLMNRGRSGLLGIGPPHVTASKRGNGLNFTQSAIRLQPLRHEALLQRPLFNCEPLRIQDFAPHRHAFGKFCQRSNIIDVASNKLDI